MCSKSLLGSLMCLFTLWQCILTSKSSNCTSSKTTIRQHYHSTNVTAHLTDCLLWEHVPRRFIWVCLAFNWAQHMGSMIKCEVKVTQSYLTLCDPMDYTVHGILQARILEWVTFPFSRRSSQPRDYTQVFCIVGGFFTSWATREAQKYWSG